MRTMSKILRNGISGRRNSISKVQGQKGHSEYSLLWMVHRVYKKNKAAPLAPTSGMYLAF